VAKRAGSVVFLDTHIVAWLYDAMAGKLSKAAEDAIEQSAGLAVSPMVRLELGYLHEIGRLLVPPAEILTELRQSIGLRESDPRLSTVVDVALDIGWTRDTFDRLIVAEAKMQTADLVTKDARIREHYERAIW
jgi:PIN domain nuclease of toxin-antitoxin system